MSAPAAVPAALASDAGSSPRVRWCAPDGAIAALLRGLGLDAGTADDALAYRGAVAVVVPENDSAAAVMKAAVVARRLRDIAAKVSRGPTEEDFAAAARCGADPMTWLTVAGAADLPTWTPEAAEADALEAEARSAEDEALDLALAAGREQPPAADEPEPRRLVAVTAAGLLSRTTPPREYLLEPWLRAKDLAMLYGWRGIGKTFAALGIAGAVAAGGSFLRWSARTPRRVLYLDGELPEETLRERLNHVILASGLQDPLGENLIFLTPDLQEGRDAEPCQPRGAGPARAAP